MRVSDAADWSCFFQSAKDYSLRGPFWFTVPVNEYETAIFMLVHKANKKRDIKLVQVFSKIPDG
jgi:hypothetical protein